MELTQKIEEIVGDLGDTYFTREAFQKLQDAFRKEFFETAALLEEDKGVATKTWIIPEGTEDPKALAERYNPGWIVSEDQPEDGKLILREDPDFKQITIIAEGEKRYKITKEIRSGSTMFDDERLREDDPELWEEITYVPGVDVLSNWIPQKDLDTVAESLGLGRQLRPMEDLTPAEVEAIRPYFYEGKKVKALIVKIAKDDE